MCRERPMKKAYRNGLTSHLICLSSFLCEKVLARIGNTWIDTKLLLALLIKVIVLFAMPGWL